MYWQMIPNADPHVRQFSYFNLGDAAETFSSCQSDWDFEIGMTEQFDPTFPTLKKVSLAAASAKGAFDWSKYLL